MTDRPDMANPARNDAVYAAGLLNRALDPATQPEAIRDFFREEYERLDRCVEPNRRVIDFGCGTGRHLAVLASRLALGVGLDDQRSYVAAARGVRHAGRLHFVVADATRVPLTMRFDLAICLTNTWGTMVDKLAVWGEMLRLTRDQGLRILSVYSPTSIPARREWYARLGHEVTRETDEYLETDGGFRSEHFSVDRLRSLIGPCEPEPIGAIGYWVRFPWPQGRIRKA